MIFLRSAVVSCAAAFILGSGLLAAQAKDGPSTVEARIRGIENSIMPGTLVKGDPVKTRTLSDLMAELHVPSGCFDSSSHPLRKLRVGRTRST